jgi:AcrR family transcriptional regulator
MRGARLAILKAAIGVFARKGYAAASIREICRTAGVTKPVLYYHFAGKEQLYRELMIDSFGQFRKDLLRSSERKGSTRDRLVTILHDSFKSTKADPSRIQFVLRMIFAPEDDHPYFNYVEEMVKQREVLAGILQEGINRGETRGDPYRLAGALQGIQLMAILENLLAGHPSLTKRSAEECVDILFRGNG